MKMLLVMVVCLFYHVISQAQEKHLKIEEGETIIPGHCICATPDISSVDKKSPRPFIVRTLRISLQILQPRSKNIGRSQAKGVI